MHATPVSDSRPVAIPDATGDCRDDDTRHLAPEDAESTPDDDAGTGYGYGV